MTRLGNVIFYVENVPKTVEFFEKAFGLERDFIVEEIYAQMKTGGTALGFAQASFAASNLGSRGSQTPEGQPFTMEIALCSEHPDASFEHAIKHGCKEVAPPEDKPWGQRTAYVETPDGILVELASEMAEVSK